MTWLPRVHSMAATLTESGGHVDWHQHPFDEVCLVDEAATRVGHAGAMVRSEPGHAFVARAGEVHCYRNGAGKPPRMWVVHFWPDPELLRIHPVLADADATRRVVALDDDHQRRFRDLFIRLHAEHHRPGEDSGLATAAWLRLLLLLVARSACGKRMPETVAITRTSGRAASANAADSAKISRAEPVPSPVTSGDRELSALWHVVHDHVEKPQMLAAALRQRIRNYDSLRHRFRAAFGLSPRQLLANLRLERAKSLLVETDLPVAEVAERLGYGRVQEFSRTFRVAAGCSPTEWRAGESRDAFPIPDEGDSLIRHDL